MAPLEEPRYPIESVDNALRLLALFISEESIRVKDAAEILGVATGTAHRLLAMLVYRGFVTQEPLSKVYVPGPMLLSVGLRASSRLNLTSQARPYLEQLNDELDETIHLAVLRGPDVLFVDGVESKKTLRVASRAGAIHPAHCTSTGKALLAMLPRARILELYPNEELPQVTGRSIGTRTQLLLELESAKVRGYAINFGELEDGIGSIAMALIDAAGSAVASIGVGAPVSRLNDERLQHFADVVKAATERLGSELLAARRPDRKRTVAKPDADIDESSTEHARVPSSVAE